MLKNIEDKYQRYFEEYKNFHQGENISSCYLEQCCERNEFNNCCLMSFDSFSKTDQIFLVVPSIFNSPEILFISRTKGFIRHLQEFGKVYLIDWHEIDDPNFNFNNYISQIGEILVFLSQRTNNLVNIIGHCIGGNMAAAAAFSHNKLVNTLMLLTTPWDFSHFINLQQPSYLLVLDANIKNLDKVPKIYIQILFFLLFPNYFDTKLDKYFSLELKKDKDLFLKIEKWLLSGHSLPKAVYYQIRDDLSVTNLRLKNIWKIGDIVVDFGSFDKPVYHVVAKNDQIVPKSSVLPLHRSLKNSRMFEVKGGHISYLINDAITDILSIYAHPH